jgi:hypothetical protein
MFSRCAECNGTINGTYPRVVCTRCGWSGCGRCAPNYRSSGICPHCRKTGLREA